MEKWEKILATIGCVAIAALIVVSAVVNFTPSGRAAWNAWMHEVQEADDATRYETRKKVEDSCRAMVASYEADKLTYEQYKDSEEKEQRSWADQAKMRANRTAANYNNYILENSYVWDGNVPEDIDRELAPIQ